MKKKTLANAKCNTQSVIVGMVAAADSPIRFNNILHQTDTLTHTHTYTQVRIYISFLFFLLLS